MGVVDCCGQVVVIMDVNEIMEFEDDGIGSQENTEPLADSGFNSQSQDESQSQSQSQTHYWGRLYPLKAALQVIGRLCLCLVFVWLYQASFC